MLRRPRDFSNLGSGVGLWGWSLRPLGFRVRVEDPVRAIEHCRFSRFIAGLGVRVEGYRKGYYKSYL